MPTRTIWCVPSKPSSFSSARGTKPADIARVEETLLRLSQLVTDFPIVQELDINPLMISNTTGEAIAVDGRIKLA